MHAFEFCPSLPLICPPRLGAGQFGLAGRGSMIAMLRSMCGSVEQSQENQNGTQAGNARLIHAFRRGL
jgi:hypothetical protein